MPQLAGLLLLQEGLFGMKCRIYDVAKATKDMRLHLLPSAKADGKRLQLMHRSLIIELHAGLY